MGWLEQIAVMWGVSPESMSIFLGFIIAFTLAIVVILELKRHGHEHAIDGGVAVFIMILFIECIIGLMNWMLFVVLIILIGVYEFQLKKGDKE